jgi:hypothetical protein
MRVVVTRAASGIGRLRTPREPTQAEHDGQDVTAAGTSSARATSCWSHSRTSRSRLTWA